MKKKSVKTAIRTDFFNPVLPQKQPDEPIVLGEGSTREEVALAELPRTGGWLVVTKLISDMMKELDDSLTLQISTGANFEEIGKTALIKETVKGYLTTLLLKVQDASEAVEQSSRERDPRGGDDNQA